MQDGYTHIRSQRLPARRLLLRVLGVLVRGAEVNLAGVHRGALRRGARSSRGGGREEGRCDGDDGAMGSCHYWLAEKLRSVSWCGDSLRSHGGGGWRLLSET